MQENSTSNIRLKVLVACEESQRVTQSFRDLGHESYSCDLQDCSGGHPEWHIKGNCLPLLKKDCSFITCDGIYHINHEWDLIIAHPPCTYLTNTQSPYYDRGKYGDAYVDDRIAKRNDAVSFFLKFTQAECNHIAIENPVGYMCTHFRHASQIIQPFWFGDPYSKKTALWLTGLPNLAPTNMLTMPERGWDNWYRTSKGRWDTCTRDENGKMLAWNDPRTAVIRSKTFWGIARAMASQWSSHILNLKMNGGK